MGMGWAGPENRPSSSLPAALGGVRKVKLAAGDGSERRRPIPMSDVPGLAARNGGLAWPCTMFYFAGPRPAPMVQGVARYVQLESDLTATKMHPVDGHAIHLAAALNGASRPRAPLVDLPKGERIQAASIVSTGSLRRSSASHRGAAEWERQANAKLRGSLRRGRRAVRHR
jgi:hypothetical protein